MRNQHCALALALVIVVAAALAAIFHQSRTFPQLVGQSSKELIMRAFGRQGYKVLDIGRAERRQATLHLDGLFWEADEVC